MRIYEFPFRPLLNNNPDNATEFQPIDLDYIVSIGPVVPVSYTCYSFGESHAYFTVYIKIGQPITITYNSGTCLKCPEYLIDGLNEERLKLIESWKNKDTANTSRF
jgi:hypothetical protein